MAISMQVAAARSGEARPNDAVVIKQPPSLTGTLSGSPGKVLAQISALLLKPSRSESMCSIAEKSSP